MSSHEQFAEDLALYALGSLQGEELAALEKHLQECSSCRRELEQLRGDMGLLALATAGWPRPRDHGNACWMRWPGSLAVSGGLSAAPGGRRFPG